MNCKNCGAQLSIDDLRCKFCGTENPEAVAYRKEKERAERQKDEAIAKARISAKLSDSIYGSTRASKVLNLVILVCLVIGIVAQVVKISYRSKYDRVMDAPDRHVRAASYAECYETLQARYEALRLTSCGHFHEQVDDYYFYMEENAVPSETIVMDLIFSARWADGELKLYKERDTYDDEAYTYETTYLRSFFTQAFGLKDEDFAFLTDEAYEERDGRMKLAKAWINQKVEANR